MFRAFAAFPLAVAASASLPDARQGSGPGYQYFCTGKGCGNYVSAKPSPGVVLMGGGTDVDAAFLWQISRSDDGDFVVFRESGTDAYNPYIYNLSHSRLNSVTTVIITDRAGASADFVLKAAQNADAIFFAGGDQTLYHVRIQGTPLAEAVQRRSEMVTIGGTSAGCDTMGQFVFAPPEDVDDIQSDQALDDPYVHGIDLVPNFLSLAPFAAGGSANKKRHVILDTHFQQRDRMGRMLTFASRLVADGNVTVDGDACAVAIGVNEQSALLVEPTGTASIVGGQDSSAAFACRLCDSPSRCESGSRLSSGPFKCFMLEASYKDTIDLTQWSSSGVKYELSVDDGDLSDDPYNPPSRASRQGPAAMVV